MSNTNTTIKRALLIGCNYTKSPSAQLRGCINDIVNVKNVLIDAYGYKPENIAILRDDTTANIPSRQNILNALNTLQLQSAKCSEVWIHYSGHGAQIADNNGDETDKLDEVLVPVDYLTSGYISDDLLFDILKMFKCKVLFFSDSCHSGSICDLQYSINYINGSFSKVETSKKSIPTNSNIIVMSGCRDAQTSADTYSSIDANFCGAFTDSLLTSLRTNNHTVDIMKIYGDICSTLLKTGYDQIPVLSSSASAPKYSFVRAGPVVQVVVNVPTPVPAKPASNSSSAGTTSVVKPSSAMPIKISNMPLTLFWYNSIMYSGAGKKNVKALPPTPVSMSSNSVPIRMIASKSTPHHAHSLSVGKLQFTPHTIV